MKDVYTIAKDFQLIIPASVALIAAGLAYGAAMARIWEDRREATFRRNNEKLGLFLRLAASLKHTSKDADYLVASIDVDDLPEGRRSLTIPMEGLDVYDPPELTEAWSCI